MTLYTIGYSGLSPAELEDICDKLEIHVLADVRAKPVSRMAGFSRKALEAQFGERYHWHGDTLGGPMHGPGVLPEGLTTIKQYLLRRKNVMLMCLEKKPEQCHRHLFIATALLPKIDAAHVFEHCLLDASALEKALETDIKAKLYAFPEGKPARVLKGRAR